MYSIDDSKIKKKKKKKIRKQEEKKYKAFNKLVTSTSLTKAISHQRLHHCFCIYNIKNKKKLMYL